MGMQVIDHHISPDGLLKFVVCRSDDGDIALGFQSSPPHTPFESFTGHVHADMLATFSGRPEEETVRGYLNELLEDRAVIAVSRDGEAIRDVWITDDPASGLKYKPAEETIEFRYWSGRRCEPGVWNA